VLSHPMRQNPCRSRPLLHNGSVVACRSDERSSTHERWTTLQPTEWSTVDDLDDLELLTKDELIEMLLEQAEAGVNLSFPGKAATRRMARRVRPRVQRTIAKYSVGPEDQRARNVLIEGDNLHALATLYRDRGHVDLILTDPPYNTGNDFRYNDRWDDDPNDDGLGDLVKADDPARHTKWMRFMYPRLQMMKAMLKPGGVLAICIDYRELFHLGQMLDELFGETNRLAIINWQKTTAPRADSGHVTSTTEYVLVYARDESRAKTSRQERKAKSDRRYGNPDGDKGLWREANLSARTYSTKGDFAIQSPITGDLHYPPGSRAWAHPKRNILSWLSMWGTEFVEVDINDGRGTALLPRGATAKSVPATVKRRAENILRNGPWPFVWFGTDGKGKPRVKTYLENVRSGSVPTTFWLNDDEAAMEIDAAAWSYEQSGRSSDGVAELTAIVGDSHGFNTVKPLKLIQKVIQLWCPAEGLVLDPFAGSGTTGHAVLLLNQLQDAHRRFILVEQGRPERGDSYARSLTSDRLSRVINGDWVKATARPLPGGFAFRQLTKRVDANALLQMEREEMVDTVIASYFDASRRRGVSLQRRIDEGYVYLVAQNADDEGFYLVWDGPQSNIDLTEEVYEACVAEGDKANLKPVYHVYARLNLFSTEGVRFYQIPDRILADFGLDVRSESYDDETSY